MTVITFPPERRNAGSDRPARLGEGARASLWRDEAARLRLLAALQRSLVEGLLHQRPVAARVLRAFR